MKLQTPYISIIVPVYKVQEYLARCVESLLAQTLSEIEIVLVDDGSPDECPKICDGFAAKDPRVRVIHKENGGLSSARNAGLDVARGQYLMFVDSDDWLDCETCDEAYALAKQNDADCVMFSYTKEFGSHSIVNHIFDCALIVWGKEEVQGNFHRRLFGPVGKELARPQDADLIVSACMQLFRADKFRDIRFVDTRKIGTEDCWYQIQVYERCGKFVYFDKPHYHYLRANANSLTTGYNPFLVERWQTLFGYMKDYINEYGKGQVYETALKNRICLSVLGAGINLAHSKDGFFRGIGRMKGILSLPVFSDSLAVFDTSVMPFHWRFFFFMAKHRMAFPLSVSLKAIEFLRTH